MKKWLVLSVFMAALPLTMMAQDDDLYFNPKQEAKKAAEERVQKAKLLAAQRARQDSIYALYWSGSDRNVDEYNRGGKLLSHYQNIGADSLGNDIISFRVGNGVAPDSIYDDEAFAEKYMRGMGDDFDCTRDLSRWDGFYDPWFYSYYGCGPYYWRSSYWRWHNPWRYGYYAGWYDPWFDPWFDPWYYGYAGWYGGPWYGWGGYYPWYWGGPMIGYVKYGGFAGNKRYNNPGRIDGSNHRFTGIAGNNRNTYSRRSGSNRSFGQRQNNGNYNNNNSSWGSRGNSGFGNSGGSFGGGSFSGGGRSGGGSFGGGHSGGGSFGGRR